MTMLFEHDLDPLDVQADAELRRLVVDLDAACTATSLAPGTRADIARTLEERADVLTRARRRPLTRLSWAARRSAPRALVAAAVLAAVIGTGAAIADPDLVQQAISLLPGGADQQYAITLDQAQSACGFTVTLRKAYADANRLIIGYDVTAPPNRTFRDVSLSGLEATEAGGTRLEPLNSSDSANLDHMVGATRGNVQEFDTNTVYNGGPLQLHLTAPALYGAEAVTDQPPTTPTCETDSAVTTAQTDRPYRGVTVAGPFSFDVTVPVSPKVRTATPQVSGTSEHGTTVTLEKVIVTPTEARLFVRGPADKPFIPVFYAGGTAFDVGLATPVGQGLWVDRIFPRPWSPIGSPGWLFDNHDAWTLKVLTDSIDVQGQSEWSGSVTLNVTVP